MNYPVHLTLDVSTDNTRAIAFYKKVGLEITNLYITEEQKVEFVTFKTPEGFVYAEHIKKQTISKSASLPTTQVAEVK